MTAGSCSAEELPDNEGETCIKVVLFDTQCDLISAIWDNRPALPDHPVYNYPVEYAGEERLDKIEAVRKRLAAHRADSSAP
ncbi:MAG: hypothetical protein MZV63_37045 [Marinilabiliales bacterium]|nr:hypothetical protein [Marinilabiliales bacterium]